MRFMVLCGRLILSLWGYNGLSGPIMYNGASLEALLMGSGTTVHPPKLLILPTFCGVFADALQCFRTFCPCLMHGYRTYTDNNAAFGCFVPACPHLKIHGGAVKVLLHNDLGALSLLSPLKTQTSFLYIACVRTRDVTCFLRMLCGDCAYIVI